MLLAEVEHLLRLLDPADQRARQRAAAEDEVADRGRRVRLRGHADEAHRAVALQLDEQCVEVVRGGYRVQNKVERALVRGHLVGVFRDDQILGAEALGVVTLVRRGREDIDLRAHRRGDLDAHVAEAAETDDADLLAGAHLPVMQRRIGGDAGAEQRRHGGKVLFVMADVENEILGHDDMVGIAAEGVAAHHLVRAVIGADEARRLAILLLAVVARGAMAAAVDHAADAGDVADLELRHVAADRGDATDDLVAGDAGVERPVPLAARGMEIGMADAAIEDVDRDVLGTGIAAFEVEGRERRVGSLGGIALGGGGHRKFLKETNGNVGGGKIIDPFGALGAAHILFDHRAFDRHRAPAFVPQQDGEGEIGAVACEGAGRLAARAFRPVERAGTLPGWIVAVLRSALGYSVPRLALAGAAVPAVPVNGLVQTIGVPLRGRPSKPVVVS
ncbi:hypothetical protein WR25_02188 [Diploscapter pachys]|uniref:Uncharacterized protein n=1 Tax=Diploscapter pachys TaxID=2018661 RepID=A0A2A2KAL6_9BILA|nr:hypothetical protein WR25_02188 [Diploscapter pachys]